MSRLRSQVVKYTKHWRSLVTVFTLFIAFNGPVSAQTFPLYMNLETGHLFNSSAQATLESAMIRQWKLQSFSQMILDDMIRKEGERKIAAGLTSNRFTPLAKNATLSNLLPPNLSESETQKLVALNEASLQSFNKLMKQSGLTVNDLADARALAFSLGFYAARGEDAGIGRLKWLQHQYAEAMNKDVMFQGYPDSWRQEQYEKMAVSAVNAVGARKKSEQPGLSQEQKEVYLALAQPTGNALLSSLWTKPTEAIEMTAEGFADRGEMIVESGSGRTTFIPSAQTNIAQVFAAQPINQVLNLNESYWSALLPRFNASVKTLGLSTNDLADANATAAAVVYPIFANGKVLNDKQVAWLRAEMRQDILGSADVQRSTDAQKQNYYETMALNSMHIIAQHEAHLETIKSANSQSTGDYLAQAAAEAANSLVLDDRNKAYALLKDIFAPRDFDEYVLAENGFQKIR